MPLKPLHSDENANHPDRLSLEAGLEKLSAFLDTKRHKEILRLPKKAQAEANLRNAHIKTYQKMQKAG